MYIKLLRQYLAHDECSINSSYYSESNLITNNQYQGITLHKAVQMKQLPGLEIIKLTSNNIQEKHLQRPCFIFILITTSNKEMIQFMIKVTIKSFSNNHAPLFQIHTYSILYLIPDKFSRATS